MGNLGIGGNSSSKPKQTLPVFVEVMNVYPFCGTIDINVTKKQKRSELLYCISNLVDDAAKYLRKYHRNATYSLNKIVHNGVTYLWNDRRMNDILSTPLVGSVRETDLKLYFVCQESIDISVRATYSSAANNLTSHDCFDLSVLYTMDYTVADLLADITRKVNKRRVGHHYETKDVAIQIDSVLVIPREINKPISIDMMNKLQENGVSVECCNWDAYEF